jgi:hypothetical protein
MKDALIGIVLTAALIVVFSAYAPILPTQTAYGVYPTQSGESGVVLPGAGDAFAELNPAISEHRTDGQTEHGQSEAEDAATDYKQTEQSREKEQSMDEIIIAFWHGVAAVLIGEACALALGLVLAAAWLRRK